MALPLSYSFCLTAALDTLRRKKNDLAILLLLLFPTPLSFFLSVWGNEASFHFRTALAGQCRKATMPIVSSLLSSAWDVITSGFVYDLILQLIYFYLFLIFTDFARLFAGLHMHY